MQQIGTVISISDTHAQVEVRRMSACSRCHKANPGTSVTDEAEVLTDVCGQCTMFPTEPTLTVDAVNEIGALPGERVVLQSSTELILGYAAAVFFLPLLLAFLLGCIMSALLPASAWAPFAGAAIGFAAAFFIDRAVLDRKAKEKTVYTIIKRLTKGPGATA